jgi:hypothetical protein
VVVHKGRRPSVFDTTQEFSSFVTLFFFLSFRQPGAGEGGTSLYPITICAPISFFKPDRMTTGLSFSSVLLRIHISPAIELYWMIPIVLEAIHSHRARLFFPLCPRRQNLYDSECAHEALVGRGGQSGWSPPTKKRDLPHWIPGHLYITIFHGLSSHGQQCVV